MSSHVPVTEGPKATSFAYGQAYQEQQLAKHRGRHSNHWRPRIQLVHDLVDRFVLPRFPGRSPEALTALDVGCSIGTMAIELAHRGFDVYGVDFDGAALEIARKLCIEEKVDVQFIEADVAAWHSESRTSIDVAVCFDIFEHLHDDELGALLQSIRRALSSRGCLLFYTFPTQYDYLLFGRPILRLPLLPFTLLPPRRFDSIVRAYAATLDALMLLTVGHSYRERIQKAAHCNPTTPDRLRAVLERARYDVIHLETAQLYPFMPRVQRWFRKQPIADRCLYGAAIPR